KLSKSLRVGAGIGAELTHLPSNPGRGAPAVGGRRQIAGCVMLMLAGLMGLLMVGLVVDFTGGVKPDEDEGEAEGGGGSETQASEPSLDGNPLAEAIGGSDGGDILAGG